ncbi:MAG TPA: amidase [Stellaceae bacterium]|jgi:aspartyl-tRNA(Asn)/glutamyl-tRNA(Gln) amidotransferase subunit A
MTLPTIETLRADLDAGRSSARDLVEQALANIADPAREGARTFLRVYAEQARAVADAQDRMRKAGVPLGPLAGIPVSVKDLFDVSGEVTTAGSRALADAPPAVRDCPVVARLRAAGAVLIGRTNMTEFAFSGLGINPHYGTPGNPADRSRIPGGSSSGAAVSVADGQAAAGIGSDTGGSVRIPSALCGLTGFKPTQRRVPCDGAVPLSTTLDSIGPLARSVADCALVDAVMAGEEPAAPLPVLPVAGLRLGVPQTLVLDGVDHTVGSAFERACAVLSAAGARVSAVPFRELAELPKINAKGGFATPEAYAWHEPLMAQRGAEYDPRVRSRIERGRDVQAADYINLIEARARFIARSRTVTAEFDALVMPTVPVAAPTIAECSADDAAYTRLNLLILRNPSVVNFLDGCALTLPIHRPGELPVGLMLVGETGADHRLLAIGRAVEAALRSGAAAE